jgi:hypothetical protein
VARGVAHHADRITRITRDEQGNIAALHTQTGAEHSGEIFIDCTGFAALLMRGALGVPFTSFKDNLFNDAAVVMPTPMDRAPPVETVSTAMAHGWRWSIPLTTRFGNGYVFSRDFTTPDAAEAELRAHLGLGDSDVEARHLTFNVGQLARHWDHNCLAVGLSQGFIEPLEATALHLVLNTVEQFVQHYDGAPRGRDAFNATISERIERVRDYIVAHYKLTTRADTDYWRANAANMNLSLPLRQILDVWFRRGDLAAELARQDSPSHFGAVSWHCLLAGYGAFRRCRARRAMMLISTPRNGSATSLSAAPAITPPMPTR